MNYFYQISFDCSPVTVYTNDEVRCNLTVKSKGVSYLVSIDFGDGDLRNQLIKDTAIIIMKKYSSSGNYTAKAIIQNNTNYFDTSQISGKFYVL